jgi:CubicO group peptidase (beta-lactamase class C family)
MRKLLVLLSVSALVVAGCAPQTRDFTGSNGLAPEQLQVIDQTVARFLPHYEYINVALVRDGEVALTRTYGRNRLDKVDVYASVSKPVTAMILLQLLEQGALDSIDDEVQRYLPAYQGVQPEPYDDTPITFVHLLTHQSGVPHLSELWNEEGQLNLAFRPGTAVQYSTQGYGILGYVMKEITGKSYERLLQEYIGDPVAASSFQASHHFTAPGGQVRSTIHDLARFAIGVMSGQYVSDGTLDTLVFKRYAQNEYGTICLGWYCSDLNSPDVTIYHNGSNGRPRAHLRIKPLKKLAVAVTGLNRSQDGPRDFPELSVRLMELLETLPTARAGHHRPGA